MSIDIINAICYYISVNGDGTHNKKQLYSLLTKGTIPIEKNIIVVDKQGNEYESTYPKRAKGLVKNGRARFIEKNKICLACPPNSKSEDNDMSDNKNTEILSLGYILKQIEKVQGQLLDLKNTVNNIGCVEDSDRTGEESTTVHDEIAIKKIAALTEVFRHREESLQKLLDIYGKMYDDLVGKKTLKDKALAALEKCSGSNEQLEKLSGIMAEIGFLEE